MIAFGPNLQRQLDVANWRESAGFQHMVTITMPNVFLE